MSKMRNQMKQMQSIQEQQVEQQLKQTEGSGNTDIKNTKNEGIDEDNDSIKKNLEEAYVMILWLLSGIVISIKKYYPIVKKNVVKYSKQTHSFLQKHLPVLIASSKKHSAKLSKSIHKQGKSIRNNPKAMKTILISVKVIVIIAVIWLLWYLWNTHIFKWGGGIWEIVSVDNETYSNSITVEKSVDNSIDMFVYDISVLKKDGSFFTLQATEESALIDNEVSYWNENISFDSLSIEYPVNYTLGKVDYLYRVKDDADNEFVVFDITKDISLNWEKTYSSIFIVNMTDESYIEIDSSFNDVEHYISREWYIYLINRGTSSYDDTYKEPRIYDFDGDEITLFYDNYRASIINHLEQSDYEWYKEVKSNNSNFMDIFMKRDWDNWLMWGVDGNITKIIDGIATVNVIFYNPNIWEYVDVFADENNEREQITIEVPLTEKIRINTEKVVQQEQDDSDNITLINDENVREFIQSYYTALWDWRIREMYDMTKFVNDTSFETVQGWYNEVDKTEIIDAKMITDTQYRIIVDVYDPTHITRYDTTKNIVIEWGKMLLENEKTHSRLYVPRWEITLWWYDKEFSYEEIKAIKDGSKSLYDVFSVAYDEYGRREGDCITEGSLPWKMECESLSQALQIIVWVNDGESYNNMYLLCLLAGLHWNACYYQKVDNDIVLFGMGGHDISETFYMIKFSVEWWMIRQHRLTFNLNTYSNAIGKWSYDIYWWEKQLFGETDDPIFDGEKGSLYDSYSMDALYAGDIIPLTDLAYLIMWWETDLPIKPFK